MSEAALQSLDTAERTLRGAIEGGSPDDIAEALVAFTAALDTVRGIGAWRVSDDLKSRLRDLMARLESDQKLSRLLGDIARQRLDALAGATRGNAARGTYGRNG